MRRAAVITAAVGLLAGGCTSMSPGHYAHPTTSHDRPPSAQRLVITPTPATTSAAPTPARARPSTSPVAHSAPLPGDHGRLIGRARVVAYYGAAGNGTLGVLGTSSPEVAAGRIAQRAAGFAGYGRRVQPAMELIATVAQGAPGHDRTYSKAVPATRIAGYLAAVHRHHMLLILDLQPGRASFLAQARALRPFLLDPSVSLALDPEWKVGPHGVPGGGRIGASSAAGINAVGSWLSRLVGAHHLPDKLLVVHQFTHSMLPDRQHIVQHRGIEMVLHADGFGAPSVKVRVLHQLAFPAPPFGVGFKLFLRQDSRLMSPREVMALHPRPDVITYQ